MKKIISLLSIIAICFTASAQTNNINWLDVAGQDLLASTNWAVLGGYGHSVKGSANLVFGDIAYNFNQYAGVVVGEDYLWTTGAREQNAVKGGLTLQLPMHPFEFLGSTSLTNVSAVPFIGLMVSQSKGTSAVSEIVVSGINFNLYKINSALTLNGGIFYESRTGDSYFSGNYWCFHLGISRGF